MRWSAAVVLLLLAQGVLSASPVQSPAQRFRCESDSSQQRYCAIDTDQGVTLVKQLSRVPCMQGRNWDYDRHGVWVSHRCAAEFVLGKEVAPEVAAQGELVRCESRDDKLQRCPADTSAGVRLVRKFSVSECVENLDWGHDDNAIWAARGCRAEFALGTERGLGKKPLLCESEDRRRRHCAASIREGADLIRQISKTRCVQGRTWDWDSNGIWVDLGCRAEFTIR